MRKYFATFSVALLMVLVPVTPATAAQFGGRRLSPAAKATCRFSNGKTITVDYSSPRVRGRKIFGGLVPFGRVWILGANQATTLTTTTAVRVDGKNVPAGSYTLFAIPTSKDWTLIFNKTSRQAIGGMSYYPGQGSDLARMTITTSRLPSKQEDFTISFVPSGNSCTMRFDWDFTRASVSITEEK